MENLFTWAIASGTAICAWIVTEFFGRPVRNFFTLRTEIRHEMLRLENVGAPDPKWTYPTYTEEALERLFLPSREAQATFRSLGTRLKAFAETEWAATKAINALGFAPMDGALGLIGLSNSFTNYGEERAGNRERIRRSLRLPL